MTCIICTDWYYFPWVYKCDSYGSFIWLYSFFKAFINSIHQIFIEHQFCAKYLAWLGAGDAQLNTTYLELAFSHQEDAGSKQVKRNTGSMVALAGRDTARRKLGKLTPKFSPE